MILKKVIFFTIITVLIQGTALSQNLPISNDAILTKQQAIDDYNILYSSLINYHPNPFLYVAENDFKAYFEKQKSNLPDTIDALAFQYICRQLTSQIRCGHTFASISPLKKWIDANKGKTFYCHLI
ncbi:MAG: hypothetical protein HC892_21715 [Saprospiraceae bacterium]|nr:hypothetical protein [Saprospiraceae bacterium]